jgi:hypothetical protein|tara:strand:+ start:159 stop:287 length:129 start_codon:yes stop_codon:yes gene_type:complete
MSIHKIDGKLYAIVDWDFGYVKYFGSLAECRKLLKRIKGATS